MRSLKGDNGGGVYGIAVMFMIFGIVAFLWLLFNTFLGTFFDMMDPGYGFTVDFFEMLWVNGGIFFVVFFVTIFSLFMYMQKSKYNVGGGGFR